MTVSEFGALKRGHGKIMVVNEWLFIGGWGGGWI